MNRIKGHIKEIYIEKIYMLIDDEQQKYIEDMLLMQASECDGYHGNASPIIPSKT